MSATFLRPTHRIAVFALAAVAILLFNGGAARAQYQYGYHPTYGYQPVGVYGGYGGGMTAGMGAGVGAGAALQGFGQAAAGVGQYQESHAQAQVVHQQAVTEAYGNLKMMQAGHQQWEQASDQYNQAQTAAARQQVDNYKRHLKQLSAPHRLTSDQFDRDHNVITWPFVLRSEEFDDERFKIDQLFHKRTAANSGDGSPNCAAIQKSCDAMLKTVDGLAAQMDIGEFMTSTHFIKSLAYEARFNLSGVDPNASN